MKRRNLIVILIMLLFMPVMAKADMDAPMVQSYEATISNPNGTPYYYGNLFDDVFYQAGRYDYGKKITIYSEEKINGETYGSFYDAKEKKDIYVLISDIVRVDKNFKYDEKDVKKANDGVVLAKNGIILRSGPSESFDKLAVIPNGTKMELNRVDGVTASGWFLTTYKGKTGWVCELNGTIGFELDKKDKKDSYIAMRDIKVYDSDNNLTGVIPANTVLKTDSNILYYVDEWSRGYYVEYRDFSGVVSYYSLASYNPGKVEIVSNNVVFYEKGELSKILEKTLPKGETFDAYYEYSYQGVLAYYINYNGTYGWIYSEDFGEWDNDNYVKFTSDNSVLPIDEEGSIDSEEKEDDTKSPEVIKTTGLTNREIVVYSVGGAIILALTMIVLIMLVNRKKDKKKKTAFTTEGKIKQSFEDDYYDEESEEKNDE